jgi:hypothetical protein
VLPAEFGQVSELTPKIQHFLEQNLPPEVANSVTLLTVNQREIVIAANSPTVANFLRLHSVEIQQQLLETFSLGQKLKYCALPDSVLKPQSRDVPAKPAPVSRDSIESITRSADWIEDENLKAAMLSLASSMKKSR